MQYRREIDGLRALAVVPVILFHAGISAISGGFVGVDVFFVISGYLITSIILAEQQAGTFSLAGFYERRARRILPALFVVLLACLPLAWWSLLPADFLGFSRSLLAVSVFASNLYFWKTSGYFDTAAEMKPLLHTWSLAVEEQYYVFFPLLLLLAWRWDRRWTAALLAAGAAASLALAQWLVRGNPTAAFYLLPTRGWELLVGALVASYRATPRTGTLHPLAAECLAGAGALMILAAIFAFDRQTPFPGIAALVPTVGAALVILYAAPATLAGRILGSRVFVGIGLVSYSAYLWHQPLFAFARQFDPERPTLPLMLALAVAALLLAALSWKFVEAPFRGRRHCTRRQIFALALGATGVLAAAGAAGVATGGFAGRLAPDQQAFLAYFENARPAWNYFTRTGIEEKYRTECDFYDLARYRGGGATRRAVDTIARDCHVRDPALAHAAFIWGDSHAQQLYYGLQQTLPPSWQILQVASAGCPPRLDGRNNPADYCEYSNWYALQAIRTARPDVVLVAQNLDHRLEAMLQIRDALLQLGVKKVVFTGPTPHWTRELPDLVVQALWPVTPRFSAVGRDTAVLGREALLKAAFPADARTRYVSIMDYFCRSDGCRIYYGDDRAAGITSWDEGHLTPVASLHFAQDVLAGALRSGVDTADEAP